MDKSIAKKLGNAIRSKRLKLGYTQEKLAYEAGVSVSYISEMERGIVNPTIDIVYQVSKVLRTTVNELTSDF